MMAIVCPVPPVVGKPYAVVSARGDRPVGPDAAGAATFAWWDPAAAVAEAGPSTCTKHVEKPVGCFEQTPWCPRNVGKESGVADAGTVPSATTQVSQAPSSATPHRASPDSPASAMRRPPIVAPARLPSPLRGPPGFSPQAGPQTTCPAAGRGTPAHRRPHFEYGISVAVPPSTSAGPPTAPTMAVPSTVGRVLVPGPDRRISAAAVAPPAPRTACGSRCAGSSHGAWPTRATDPPAARRCARPWAGLHWRCRPGIPATHLAPRPTTPRMGDQAVPAGHIGAVPGGGTTCSGSSGRSPSATRPRRPRCWPTGSVRPSPHSATDCSSSATTTSATR